jgi:hypothetical protein
MFTPVQVAEVKALACQLPADVGVPLARWSCPDLASQAITAGIADTLSVSTVRRRLAADAIKPWQYRSWIFPRDPAPTPDHRHHPADSLINPRRTSRANHLEL